jgi:hypothetical protein
MSNKMDKFQQIAILNRPCNCNAPIAFTCVDVDEKVKTTIYSIDDNFNTSTLYSEEYEDGDAFCLLCTKCGIDWSGYNLIFD